MNIHELNTKAITNPAYVALDDGSDTYKLDLNAKLSTMQVSISGAESNISTLQDDVEDLQENPVIYHGECSTSASSTTKTVSVIGFDGKEGDLLVVRFINGNTASSFQMNVSSTGARNTLFFNNTSALEITPNSEILFEVVEVATDTLGYYFVGLYPKEKFEEIDSDITDLKSALSEGLLIPIIVNTVTGTRYVTTNWNIPAGTYRLVIDDITSSDTDASTCAINFGSGLVQYQRGVKINTTITLANASTTQYWYASDNANHGNGDTVTFTNVAICEELIDASLTTADKAADAKATGDAITALQNAAFIYNGSLPYNNLNYTASGLKIGSYSAQKTSTSVGFPEDMTLNHYASVVFYLTIANDVNRRCFIVADNTTGEIWHHSGAAGYIKLALASDVTPIFSGVKWACIGDSLTDPITTRASVKYYDYIEDETGVSFTNLGVSGTGYVNDYNGAGKFISRVASVPDDCDILTIFGGVNDLNQLPIGTADDTNNSTVLGNVYLTMQEVFAEKPNVLLGIITPTPTMQYTPFSSNNMATFVDELKKLCAKYSVPCLDLFHNSNLRPWDATFRTNYYSKDGGNGTHPDEAGNKRFAGQVLQFLKEFFIA